MHLLRCLFFIEAQLQLATHIAGVHNNLAHDLSCNRHSSFLSKAPWATPHRVFFSHICLALLVENSSLQLLFIKYNIYMYVLPSAYSVGRQFNGIELYLILKDFLQKHVEAIKAVCSQSGNSCVYMCLL